MPRRAVPARSPPVVYLASDERRSSTDRPS
jgi:hypothetical protein